MLCDAVLVILRAMVLFIAILVLRNAVAMPCDAVLVLCDAVRVLCDYVRVLCDAAREMYGRIGHSPGRYSGIALPTPGCPRYVTSIIGDVTSVLVCVVESQCYGLDVPSLCCSVLRSCGS
jgi:hypothetical protein